MKDVMLTAMIDDVMSGVMIDDVTRGVMTDVMINQKEANMIIAETSSEMRNTRRAPTRLGTSRTLQDHYRQTDHGEDHLILFALIEPTVKSEVTFGPPALG